MNPLKEGGERGKANPPQKGEPPAPPSEKVCPNSDLNLKDLLSRYPDWPRCERGHVIVYDQEEPLAECACGTTMIADLPEDQKWREIQYGLGVVLEYFKK